MDSETVREQVRSGYSDRMADWQDPLYKKVIANLALPSGAKPSDYITSLEVTARKHL